MFKKLALVCIAVLILAGCSDATLTPPSSEALFTIENKVITKADLFTVMNGNDAGNEIMAHAQEAVLEALVPSDDAFNKEASEKLEELKKGYGDLWKTILAYYGFDTDAAYLENILAPALRLEKAVSKAMNDDYSGLIDGIFVRKAAVLEVSKDKAEEAAKALKDGKSWEEVSKEYAVEDSKSTGEIKIYHKDSSDVDNAALSYIISQTAPSISDPLTITSNENVRLIVNVVSADTDALKDEVIKSFSQDTTYQKKYISKMLKDNNFKVYDKPTYEAIKKDYPEALAN